MSNALEVGYSPTYWQYAPQVRSSDAHTVVCVNHPEILPMAEAYITCMGQSAAILICLSETDSEMSVLAWHMIPTLI